jgi:hypothetical protein
MLRPASAWRDQGLWAWAELRARRSPKTRARRVCCREGIERKFFMGKLVFLMDRGLRKEML